MKLIALSKNSIKDKGKYFAQVSDEDFEFINQFNWCTTNKTQKTLYAKRSKKGLYISMHRFLLNVKDKNMVVDHIDHNGLNNQRSNLRICTQRENARNTSTKGRSKFLGVYHRIAITEKGISNTYIAQIQVETKKIYLGSFKDEIKCALCYNSAAKKYFGEFANLNKI